MMKYWNAVCCEYELYYWLNLNLVPDTIISFTIVIIIIITSEKITRKFHIDYCQHVNAYTKISELFIIIIISNIITGHSNAESVSEQTKKWGDYHKHH